MIGNCQSVIAKTLCVVIAVSTSKIVHNYANLVDSYNYFPKTANLLRSQIGPIVESNFFAKMKSKLESFIHSQQQ